MKVFKAFSLITGILALLISFLLDDNQINYLLRAYGFLFIGITHFLLVDKKKRTKIIHIIQGLSLIATTVIILYFKDAGILGSKAIPLAIYFISRGYELFFIDKE